MKKKIVFFSDSHGEHRKLNLPDADMLIFAGDAGTYRSPYQNEAGIRDFIDWLGSVNNIPIKIWIAGNHCTSIEHRLVDARTLSQERGLIYLENETIEIGGIKIFGSPITPSFGFGWAFNANRGDRIREYWSQIPNDVDIVVTHGPAHGIRDRTIGGEHVGCVDLLAKINLIKPSIFVFGHIHEACGITKQNDTLFINASVLDERYKLVNKPVLVELENKKATPMIF